MTRMKMIVAMSAMSAHVLTRAPDAGERIADDGRELVRGRIEGAGLDRRLEATDPRVGDQEADRHVADERDMRQD